jgi:hypothetical protein
MCVYTHTVQSGDAGREKGLKIWDSSELRVPEVRHPCPRGTDIASRLLRKPKNSYMLLILSKNVNIVREDREARFIVKKGFSPEVIVCPVIRMRDSSYNALRLQMLAVTDQSRGDKQVSIRLKSDSICFHSSFVCRTFMEIKIHVAVIVPSVLCGCRRTWSLNARRKWQEAGQNCVTYFIICTLHQTLFGSSNVPYFSTDNAHPKLFRHSF